MISQSHIEQLIHDLCPYGVPYRTLGEVCGIDTGNRNRQDAVQNGKYPFYVRSKEVFRIDSYSYDEEAIIIPGEGGIGTIFHYVNGKYDLHQRAYRIYPIKQDVCAKYVFYVLKASFKEYILGKAFDATVTSIRKPMLQSFPLPLPPLPIQEEIVRILDTFAKLIENIDAELVAVQQELELSRNELLRNIKCGFGPLSEFFFMRGGYTPSTSNPEFWTNEGGYPWYTMDDIRKNGRKLKDSIRHITAKAIKSKGLFPAGTIVFATSATIGEHALLMCPALTNQRFTALIPKSDNVYMPFYYHYGFIIDEWCLQHIKRGGFCSVDMDGFAKLPIPLPPLAEQRAIAEKLDTIEAFINNLKTERDLRQQQYEYYREHLINLLK